MTKFGQVVEYDSVNKLAQIHFSRPEACSKCGACGGGGQTGSITLQADCKVGDWVRVEYPENRFLEATAIAYIIPLVGLFIGIGLGWLLGRGGDAGMLIGALVGLALSVGILFLVEKRVSGKAEWTPRVTAVYYELPTMEDIGCNPS